jgi:predicted ribosomally synthesized peptide with SipW-like signal peptide
MDERFDISRRKALAALGTIGVASAGAGLGTSAYFSDQETFENNSLTAGTLDMGVGYTAHYSDWSDDEGEGVEVQMYDGPAGETGTEDELPTGTTGLPANDAWLIAVDEPDQFLDNTLYEAYPNVGSEDDPEQGDVACVDNGEGALVANTQADDADKPIIEMNDVKPGDFGEITFDLVLCDNPGYIWLNGSVIEESENGVTEPEADDPDEDQVEGDGDPALKDDADQEEGKTVELLDVAEAAVWIDDGNNYQNGDETLAASGTLREVLGMIDDSNGTPLTGNLPAEDGGGTGRDCFAANTDYSVAFAWWVPVDHGNEIQSDSATFDLGFYTEQCRHNDGSGMNNADLGNQTDDS